MPAQCIVIESDVDEKSGQISATVIIRKGCLRTEEVFVSGLHEGRVRMMLNDRGEPVKIAYPGQAVHLRGFKHNPDVGNPLYVVRTPEEARHII